MEHDLHFLRMRREQKVAKRKDIFKKDIQEIYNMEKFAIENSNTSLFFSGDEVKIIQDEFKKGNPRVISWIQKENAQCSSSDSGGIVFLGGFQHTPNVDAVKWLYEEIAPELYKMISEVQFEILGSKMTPEIQKMNDDNFNCIGFVDDDELERHLCNAKLFVAPLRYGAGFKGKIAMAMSYGIPVITTDIGAEGIGLIHKETAMIANNAKDFALCIKLLYEDKILYDKIAKNSLEYIKNNYSTKKALEIMNDILET